MKFHARRRSIKNPANNNPAMPIVLKSSTLEARIIRILLDRYPVTLEEIMEELKLSQTMVEREINRLVSKGYIAMEPLPDKTYVRLARMDFQFVGRNETQKRALKHKGGKKRGGKTSPSDYMYG